MLEEYEELNYQLEKRVEDLLDENERLNKRNKEIYEGFMATTKELTEYAEENERLKDLCDKYEEEHKTVFEEWKKTINIINELKEWFKGYHKSYASCKWYEEDYIEFIEHLENELKGAGSNE